MKIVVVSGGFDPIHSGHIEYFKAAKLLGDKLVVAINSDEWLVNKKGKFFMPFNERANIISNLEMVDDVIDVEDDTDGSCALALEKLKRMNPHNEIIFCNGGDRQMNNIPEMKVKNIAFKFGIGGNNKMNSSSQILKDWNFDSEERVWGKFYTLFSESGLKVKELIIAPGKGMSFQRHFKRNEIWFISKGKCKVNFSNSTPENLETFKLKTENIFHLNIGSWHQIFNPYENPCHIIEIQYGKKVDENDIERLRYYPNKL